MKLEVTVKMDPEQQELLERLLEAIWDLAEVVAPMTGYKVKRSAEEVNQDEDL